MAAGLANAVNKVDALIAEVGDGSASSPSSSGDDDHIAAACEPIRPRQRFCVGLLSAITIVPSIHWHVHRHGMGYAVKLYKRVNSWVLMALPCLIVQGG